MVKKNSPTGDHDSLPDAPPPVGSDPGAPALFGMEPGSPKAAPYVVLARKYRPQNFDDLIGQEAMVQTLRNAFKAGRIAQGYMLTGVRGVGKTTTARILARALNYDAPGHAGPSVDFPALGRHCQAIMESRHADVVEMDAASNTGVDNVREIIESTRYKPILARTKVFIIDEVHMLSKGAFNALLKTLEEPPEHVKFIFATTEVRKVPVTVLSRCQRFDLKRVPVDVLARHFGGIAGKEGATASPQALALIARAAEGSVRDGLSILDQAIAHGQGTVAEPTVLAMLGLADRGRIVDLLELLLQGDAGSALGAFGALHRDGAEPSQIIADLAEAVHELTRARIASTSPSGFAGEVAGEAQTRAGALAAKLSVPLVSRIWQMLLKGLDEVARAPSTVAAAEMVLIRIAHTADLPSPDELIRAVTAGGLAGAGAGGKAGPLPSAGGRETVQRDTTHQGAGELAAAPTDAPHARPRPGNPDPAVRKPEFQRQVADAHATSDGEPVRPNAADFGPEPDDEAEGDPGMEPAGVDPALDSFAGVVALVARHRDVRLEQHLENHVSLVKFDGRAGLIELCPLPGAPPELANALREKLNRWTGRRWMVALSKSPGQPTLAEARRARQAEAERRLRAHPAVAQFLAVFPDAMLTPILPDARPLEDSADELAGRELG